MPVVWKKRAAALAVLLLASVLFSGAGHGAAKAENANILRLHVIADSDSAFDQAVKLRVRDAILSVMKPCATAAEAEAFLLENGRLILETAERTLAENGCGYGAQLMLGEYPFPDRTYGGEVYPAGDYRALRVVLGSGAGQNWWCVLFPPLCLITKDAERLPDADDITFESSIAKWIRSWRTKR